MSYQKLINDDGNDGNGDNSNDINPKDPHLEAAKKLVKKLKAQNLIKSNPDTRKQNDPIRYFKICNPDNVAVGRFSGVNPKQAANKAFCYLIKQGKESPITFCLQEMTRGSTMQIYKFTGERIKLETPQTIKIGTGEDMKEITYNYKNKVKKVKN